MQFGKVADKIECEAPTFRRGSVIRPSCYVGHTLRAAIGSKPLVGDLLIPGLSRRASPRRPRRP